MGDLAPANMAFNLVLAVSAFVSIFACFRRQRQLEASNQEMRRNHNELIGEIQRVLATVSGDVDRLRHLIPEAEAPEAQRMVRELVRAIDEIILITRGEWET
jgi:hypothetical protein